MHMLCERLLSLDWELLAGLGLTFHPVLSIVCWRWQRACRVDDVVVVGLVAPCGYIRWSDLPCRVH